MLFNSLSFLVFFSVVVPLNFLLPKRFRWFMLLLASCYFYMAFVPVYILILAFTICVDYFAGILIERHEGKQRKMWLTVSVIANVGVLAFFKYYNFLNDTLLHLFEAFHLSYSWPNLSIVLPIGLSFHTFQSLSYTIEVYKKRHPAEKNFGVFSLYVMFWPQLVAGPIERPQNLLDQFHSSPEFDRDLATRGLRLILRGFLKKVVIADRLAVFVNAVYGDPQSFPGISMILATVFFSFQIYCDFSGYSDIACGSANVMGYRLMKNFNRPYLSRSVSEFWSRWHISLSTWFRDYVYIPLGGNRLGNGRTIFNLLITFLLSGLWHGANWTYVIWGGLNGFYLIAEKLVGLKKPGTNVLQSIFRCALTFACISFAWIFFRAQTVHDAFYITTHLFSGIGNLLADISDRSFVGQYIYLNQKRSEFFLACLLIIGLIGVELANDLARMEQRLVRLPVPLRWGLYYAGVWLILLFGAFTQSQQFIYFQF